MARVSGRLVFVTASNGIDADSLAVAAFAGGMAGRILTGKRHDGFERGFGR